MSSALDAAPAPSSQFGPLFWRKVIAAFVRAFTITFMAGATGLFDSISNAVSGEAEFSTTLSVLVALVLASIAAAVRAAQALFTTIETPTASERRSVASSINPREVRGGEEGHVCVGVTSAGIAPGELISVLRGLAQLREEGILSDEEYFAEKKSLLSRKLLLT